MADTQVLLYNYSEDQVKKLQSFLAPLQEVRVVPVAPAAYGMTLEEVLSGKRPSVLGHGTMERKLLVLAGAEGQLFHFLLSACSMVTGEEKVLRAVLTKTNRTWTGAALYAHLLEEEAELEKRSKK